jgi:hypothetical protein
VQDPPLVRRFDRIADLQTDVDHFERVEPHTALDQRPEGVAFQQLHAHEQLAVRELVAVVDADDVAVIEQRERLALADEPLAAINAELERLVEHLDGHGPIELEVMPAPHGPHAALADLVEHLDPPGQDAARMLLGDQVRRVAVLVEQQETAIVFVFVVGRLAVVVVGLLAVVAVDGLLVVSVALVLAGDFGRAVFCVDRMANGLLQVSLCVWLIASVHVHLPRCTNYRSVRSARNLPACAKTYTSYSMLWVITPHML